MLESFQLKLKPVLVSAASEGKRVFAFDSTKPRSHAASCERSHVERPQLSRKAIPLTALDSWSSWHHSFLPHLPPPAVIHLFIHITSVGQPLWDCIIKLTGSITVLLQSWLTLFIPTLKQRLHWFLKKLKCPSELSSSFFSLSLFFDGCCYYNAHRPRSPRPTNDL